MATGQTGSVAWVVVTVEDLYSRLVGAQMDALRNAALGSNQSGDDVFNAIMPDVVRRIRQYIASNPRNRLSSTDYSVPPECKWMTVWLVLQDMVGRLSIAIPLNEDQKRQVQSANDDLDKLRTIQAPWLAISNPVDPEPNPELKIGVNAVVVRADPRVYTKCSLRAL